MLRFLISLLFLSGSWTASAQSWSVHLSGNETFILGSNLKTQHPILGWSSAENQGFIVGGFGLGVSHARPWGRKNLWRFQFNAQRSRYYDVPTILRDLNGAPLGAVIGVNTNYNLSLLAMGSLPLLGSERWWFSTGMGARGLISSTSNYGIQVINGAAQEVKVRNESMAPLVLLLPVEFSYRIGRFRLIARWELGVTRFSRLVIFREERGLWSFFEFAYQLNPIAN